ncbi:peptidase T [Allorhizobium pseudoryzae]|uniref:peptidase T n=1 Tax=Allorhizobium pseudoryzae TaxID=379684 RepID=UPI003D03FDEE
MSLPTDTVLDRFLRYVVIDTQSDPTSSAQPSTEKQKTLGRILEQELKALGLADAHLDEHGNVYATIPATSTKAVPAICFCSHMDTAPDFSGTGVKPQIVKAYQGGDIRLVGDESQVIRVAEHPELKNQIGHDIVTTDGTTLLGADDKAGVAEIMTAAQYLVSHPEIAHGPVKILFTTDEEIGRGADKVDLKKLGAAFGYTLDGSTIGEIENETFSADGVTIAIKGVAIHPGTAKGKMENAIKIAADIVARLPKDQAPETTEGRQGFIHPVGISGAMEGADLGFIIRDFTEEGLVEKEELLKAITEEVMKAYPGSTFTFTVKQQYRNMKIVLDRHPEVMENLIEATRRVGLEPKITSIRGGTDGSRLSFMGLPCPNIFTGGHAYHSPLEWVSVQDMETSVKAIVELVKVWEERAA